MIRFLLGVFMLVWVVWMFAFANTCTKSWSVGWRKVTWTPWDTLMSYSALVMFPLLLVVLDHA